MMKIIKKNQLTILVLALMLVTAGYLNYNANEVVTTQSEIASIGDATLVSSNALVENENMTSDFNSVETGIVPNEQDNVATETSTNSIENNTTETSSNITENTTQDDYYSSSRLERETMYSQMLESYQKILDSQTTSSKQKEAAQKEIKKINDTKNALMITENLIKTKGFEDCIVYENDDSINAIIKKDQLNKEDTAQIQSVIAREMNARIENIHILTK